ncbi:MAG: ABC-2 transporter permease [Clostridiales Family XIII bacterium]|nr:ABC-2 transporter permease [Clostridiales Family XIII bacterium]
MKKLIWLEYMVSKQGLLLAGGFYVCFVVMAILGERSNANWLYFLPSMISGLTLNRAITYFDRYDMDRVYILLPIKISKTIGAKYIFHNTVLLVFSVIVCVTYVMTQYVGDYAGFNINFALIYLGIGLVMVNAGLCGYYFLGAVDAQMIPVVIMLIVVCFLNQLMRVHVTMAMGVVTILIAMGISIILYLCACVYVAANAIGRINIKRIP